MNAISADISNDDDTLDMSITNQNSSFDRGGGGGCDENDDDAIIKQLEQVFRSGTTPDLSMSGNSSTSHNNNNTNKLKLEPKMHHQHHHLPIKVEPVSHHNIPVTPNSVSHPQLNHHHNHNHQHHQQQIQLQQQQPTTPVLKYQQQQSQDDDLTKQKRIEAISKHLKTDLIDAFKSSASSLHLDSSSPQPTAHHQQHQQQQQQQPFYSQTSTNSLYTSLVDDVNYVPNLTIEPSTMQQQPVLNGLLLSGGGGIFLRKF